MIVVAAVVMVFALRRVMVVGCRRRVAVQRAFGQLVFDLVGMVVMMVVVVR